MTKNEYIKIIARMEQNKKFNPNFDSAVPPCVSCDTYDDCVKQEPYPAQYLIIETVQQDGSTQEISQWVEDTEDVGRLAQRYASRKKAEVVSYDVVTRLRLRPCTKFNRYLVHGYSPRRKYKAQKDPRKVDT